MGEGEQSELLFPLEMRSIELLSLSVLSGSDLAFCQIQYFQGPRKQNVPSGTGGCKAEYGYSSPGHPKCEAGLLLLTQ